MIITLIDGTYELFRAYYGAPSATAPGGREVGATRTLLRSFANFLKDPAVTHVAVAFDTVIESFRNRMFAGYKTGEGIDPALFSQFPLAERATRALGMVTWSMIEFEADDALATFATRADEDPRVSQVRIASPDKDFCQCVRGSRVVLLDRKTGRITDEAGALARLSVLPDRVPSFLALVGDTADGIPGIARWGEKSAARVLERFPNIAAIPARASDWGITLRSADALADTLASSRDSALLYEQLATLRTDVPLAESVDHLAYAGPDAAALEELCDELGSRELFTSVVSSLRAKSTSSAAT